MDKFKSIDIYGHSIGVHYRGDSSYRTSLGSFVTLITVALVMSYTTIKVTEMVGRTSQNERTRSLKVDLNESGQINLAENNFNFGFYTTDSLGQFKSIPKRIGELKAYQVDTENFTVLRATELEVKKISED